MDVEKDGLGERGPEEKCRSSSTEVVECDGDHLAPGKKQYEDEISALIKSFNEEEALQFHVRYRKDRDNPANVQRKQIATFLEGSRLPFSDLVKKIYQRLSSENDQDQTKSAAITMASVKSSVLSLGERLSFGITNPDADVLEDDNARSLWCWEARDVKLLPRVHRDKILDHRRLRRKIGERISALSATIDAFRLELGESDQPARLQKALETLMKVDDESVIRSTQIMSQEKKESGTSLQANSIDIEKTPLGEQPSKERLRQEKLLKRQQVEHEKEQKRKEKEEADRKKQQQKLQDEAEKEQKRKDKEDGERRKQEKRIQDEAEKEQKREAERKKQLALKKQASFMDRFLVKKDTHQSKDQAGSSPPQIQKLSEAQAGLSSPVSLKFEKSESVSPIVQDAQKTASVVSRMDVELQRVDVVRDAPELLRSHVNYWLSVRNQAKSRKNHMWGVRRKPKVSVYKELRLGGGTIADARFNIQDDGHVRKGASENWKTPAIHVKRTRDEFDNPENFIDLTEDSGDGCPNSPLEEGIKSSSSSSSRYNQLRKKKRKLLQFDKSHRPPYYGTLSKKSEYIKPRNPLKQDPNLDYEVDSDEEWEEEDPGESLSDIEKDEEDEKGETESIEDEEDDFVVPDGYLSENEGVAMEDAQRDVAAAGGSSANQSSATTVMTMERLRKVLDNVTDHAIRSNHPFIISNLGQLPVGEEGAAASQASSKRSETMCLEALRMRVLVPNLVIGAC